MFPMYVVAVSDLAQLSAPIPPHEEMMRRGLLYQVSHRQSLASVGKRCQPCAAVGRLSSWIFMTLDHYTQVHPGWEVFIDSTNM